MKRLVVFPDEILRVDAYKDTIAVVTEGGLYVLKDRSLRYHIDYPDRAFVTPEGILRVYDKSIAIGFKRIEFDEPIREVKVSKDRTKIVVDIGEKKAFDLSLNEVSEPREFAQRAIATNIKVDCEPKFSLATDSLELIAAENLLVVADEEMEVKCCKRPRGIIEFSNNNAIFICGDRVIVYLAEEEEFIEESLGLTKGDEVSYIANEHGAAVIIGDTKASIIFGSEVTVMKSKAREKGLLKPALATENRLFLGPIITHRRYSKSPNVENAEIIIAPDRIYDYATSLKVKLAKKLKQLLRGFSD